MSMCVSCTINLFLSLSTNIPDHTRSISGLVVSPLGNLAAMADKLGRVLLLEVDTMVVRRIWKGGDRLVPSTQVSLLASTRI